MRLLSAYVTGYGRLVNVKVNLDAKVIAVVGPNEAGKTTLLKALAYLDTAAPLPVAERARAGDVQDDSTITSVKYVLDDQDRKAVEDLALEEPPQDLVVKRSARGQISTIVSPTPRRSRTALKTALQQMTEQLAAGGVDDLGDPDTIYGDHRSDAARSVERDLRSLVQELEQRLALEDEDEDEDVEAELANSAERLRRGILDADKTAALHRALDAVVITCGRPVLKEAGKRLYGRSPDFLQFTEAERTLDSSYEIGRQGKVPASLSNIAQMAGLNMLSFAGFLHAGDIARRETALAAANARLDEVFRLAWRQSRLTVYLLAEGTTLRVLVRENGINITAFDERSAGLRMFVSLTAFLGVRGSARPPVLLIDEAENHLHLDAQADLVNMFVTQQRAAKVIYTTHSPACLPADLGAGIRSVVPRRGDPNVSEIKNNFWQGSAGFTPLMLAMGAAAAAFTPARRVVLAEGASEMILLPSLIRAATGLDSLIYQVAPGLSEVPKEFYASLDLEAAKVAYLVDSDAGGEALKKGLVKAGVPEAYVVSLGVPGVENLLEPASYIGAFTSLTRERNGRLPDSNPPPLDTLQQDSWVKRLSSWVVSEGRWRSTRCSHTASSTAATTRSRCRSWLLPASACPAPAGQGNAWQAT